MISDDAQAISSELGEATTKSQKMSKWPNSSESAWQRSWKAIAAIKNQITVVENNWSEIEAEIAEFEIGELFSRTPASYPAKVRFSDFSLSLKSDSAVWWQRCSQKLFDSFSITAAPSVLSRELKYFLPVSFQLMSSSQLFIVCLLNFFETCKRLLLQHCYSNALPNFVFYACSLIFVPKFVSNANLVFHFSVS